MRGFWREHVTRGIKVALNSMINGTPLDPGSPLSLWQRGKSLFAAGRIEGRMEEEEEDGGKRWRERNLQTGVLPSNASLPWLRKCVEERLSFCLLPSPVSCFQVLLSLLVCRRAKELKSVTFFQPSFLLPSLSAICSIRSMCFNILRSTRTEHAVVQAGSRQACI